MQARESYFFQMGPGVGKKIAPPPQTYEQEVDQLFSPIM